MALSLKARKRWTLLILLVALPLYVVVAVNVIDWANAKWGRLPIWAEFFVFVALGILWALPFKPLFKGVGQADPEK